MRLTRFTFVLLASAGFCLNGCRSTMSHSDSQGVVPAESNAELIEYIAEQPFVTAEAAYRSIYILSKGQVYSGDFGGLTETLASEKIVSPMWRHSADHVLNRGAVGFMVARAIDIQGGINWFLTGLGRYALRELQYRQIAHSGGELSLVSGGEYLGMLARAEEYLFKKRGAEAGGRAELGPEPSN